MSFGLEPRQQGVLSLDARKDQAFFRSLVSACDVCADLRPFWELTFEDSHREWVLNEALDGALERPRTVVRVVSSRRDQVHRHVADFEAQPLVCEEGLHSVELNRGDLTDLLALELSVDDHVVDAIQELGFEVRTQRLVDPLFDLALLVAPEADDVFTADVRRHDQDNIAKVDRSSLAVRQATLVEDLQENVEDVGMGDLGPVTPRVNAAQHWQLR